MLSNLLLGEVAQSALAAGGATVGAEREGRAQAAAELAAQVAIECAILEALLDLSAERRNEILHLPAVFALPCGVDQAIEAIDEGPVATLDFGVAALIAAFPV